MTEPKKISREAIAMAFDLLDSCASKTVSSKDVKTLNVNSIVSNQIKKSLSPTSKSLEDLNRNIYTHFQKIGELVKSLHEKNVALLKSKDALETRLDALERNSGSNKPYKRSTHGGDLRIVIDVSSPQDLIKLSEMLLTEHKSLIKKGNGPDARLLETTINTIEMSNAVPETAYRLLDRLGIRLVQSSGQAPSSRSFLDRQPKDIKTLFGFQ